MSRHTPRRPWAAAITAVAALAIALTGCVGIPTSGQVTVGQALTQQDAGDFEFFPLGPAAGADQEGILEGFVAAFTGSAGDYGVARQFLSSGFSDQWNPRSNVTLRTNAQRYVTVDETSMEYSVNAAATVDSVGQFRQANAPAPLTMHFSFVMEDGQWRISSAPDGIVLADATFRAIFDTHTLYFLDPTGIRLVPDRRWFPAGTAALRVVSTLLDGPPAWLQGAARTAFPEGTRLASPGVDVQSGVALVDLSTEALAASSSERQMMQLQLTASLTNVPNIRRVSISVGDTPLQVPEVASSAPQTNPQVDARALAFDGTAFGFLVRDQVAPIAGLSQKVAQVRPLAATLSVGADAAAVLGAEGAWVVRTGDTPSTLLDTRQDLVAPSLDDYGYVWVASRRDASVVRVYDYAGVGVDIRTGLSADAGLSAIVVSRDGARVAILASTPAGPRLVVSSIIRDANAAQVPTALSAPVIDASTETGAALDATWVDELSVAVLSGAGTQRDVTLYEVGGERSSLGQPGAAVSLVGGNGEAGLRGLSESGTILARSGNGWTDTGIEVAFLGTQR
ncbi:MAG: GerMN domain-containing protein [Burkholderiaceae bacterium]|nr:GerMN domain-containing protein [Microbacteriaceae bacterium]